MNNLGPSKDLPHHQNTNESLDGTLKKAQQQAVNCLDLSKRNLIEFPAQLLELVSLQVCSTLAFLHD